MIGANNEDSGLDNQAQLSDTVMKSSSFVAIWLNILGAKLALYCSAPASSDPIFRLFTVN